jgi:hypothetical protein
MSFMGLEPERIRLDWVSASEGARFSKIMIEFTETIRGLGQCEWKQKNNEVFEGYFEHENVETEVIGEVENK